MARRPRPLVLLLAVVLVGVAGGVGARLLRERQQSELLPVRVVVTSSAAEISAAGERDGECVEAAVLGECLPVVRVMQEPGEPLRALTLTGVISPGVSLLYWGCREGAGVPVCTTDLPQPADAVVCVTTSSERDLQARAACLEMSGATRTPAPVARTEVVQFVPVTRDGRPAPGYQVTEIDGQRPDRCSPAYSATAPEIVSCLPFVLGAHACWIEPDRTRLLCGRPGDNQLIRYEMPQPVVGVDPPAEEKRDPLLIELRDGTKCTMRWGGPHPPLPGLLTARYYCGERGILVQAPDDPLISRTDPYWTVGILNPRDGGDAAAVKPHEVALVHYAGRP
ncbi:hypothetical protein [Micromonospora sp. NPDC047074]|uniref:hypothetical protein n=1 Tax=Micromonospora sp. NPDC047074 TaxID=3154339 RepID=UPI0033C7C6D3